DRFELSYTDEFDELNVSARCGAAWFSRTPWNGDFGDARFADPAPGFPFLIEKGVLRIEASRDVAGRWSSGLLSARDSCRKGFAQRYGYFEIRAMLPEGAGFWPAFWLIGVNTERFTAELDVFEHHGHSPSTFVTTMHVHPWAKDVARVNVGHVTEVKPGLLSERFNTWGVEIGETDTVVYFNRREVWRFPTPPELRQPMYPLINLALDLGFATPDTPEKAFMYVDYFRAYSRKPESDASR
ncbi:MAG: glycoside hydrolase family 16 protein, partial [Parvularculaceae bacterium]|nr:glycoside hydrolase family 16 protein [Parvularculaceae bacterium]